MKKNVSLMLIVLLSSCNSIIPKQDTKRMQKLESIKEKYQQIQYNCYYFSEEGASLAKTLKVFVETHEGLSIKTITSTKNSKGVFITFSDNKDQEKG